MDSKKQPVKIDVREDIKRGKEPFSRIMAAVANLGPEDEVLLIAPFEPVPLYSVLGAHGFRPEARELDTGDYEVLFRRSNQVSQPKSSKPISSSTSCKGSPVLEVDARGLEPPEPLVKILEAVAGLPRGAHLRAYTDRRPMHLYTQLIDRGFSGQTEEQPDGSFVTYVRPL